MAEILAVGAYELFPAQEASSSERKNGAKYVITRYNLTYVSPFWNSAAGKIHLKLCRKDTRK